VCKKLHPKNKQKKLELLLHNRVGWRARQNDPLAGMNRIRVPNRKEKKKKKKKKKEVRSVFVCAPTSATVPSIIETNKSLVKKQIVPSLSLSLKTIFVFKYGGAPEEWYKLLCWNRSGSVLLHSIDNHVVV